MRAYAFAGWGCVWAGMLGLLLSLGAVAAPVNPDDLDNLFRSLHAPNATEMPRQLQTAEGYVRFVGAPPGGYFTTSVSGAKSSSPETVAHAFVSEHLGAFAGPSAHMAFDLERVKASGDNAFVKLQQTYNGLEVFSAQLMVQIDAFGGVISALSDILRDASAFDGGQISITPSVTVDAANTTAIQSVAQQYSVNAGDLVQGPASRMLLDPVVVGGSGPAVLVWAMTVRSTQGAPVVEYVFVDAHANQVVFHYPLIHDARVRKVYDAHNNNQYSPDFTFDWVGTLARSEGDPATGLREVDLAYDDLGNVYDFYFTVHHRDSIDGNGLPIRGTVRFCEPLGQCPFENAFYSQRDPTGAPDTPNTEQHDHMYFGDGFASALDVAGHELTHGVTSYESGLIYANQSGAINEAFSDIWGEFIEMAQHTGDYPGRWLMGEDTPLGAGRNMKDPPEFQNPDRVGSPYFYTGPFDGGGVHTNSGVINKLCYLLTDGDTFNGRTVKGSGSIPVAKLFYECQTNLLIPASDFEDLYMALGQATINLGYSFGDRLNVKAAGQAVEISPTPDIERIPAFRAIPAFDASGRPVIALTWKNPTAAGFRRVVITRDTKNYPGEPTEGLEVYRGKAEKFLDAAVVGGTQYFYTIFTQVAAGFPDKRSAKALAGGPAPDFLTETFAATSSTPGGVANPCDLSFTQLTFSPTGAASSPLGEAETAADYSQYTVSLKRGVFELPVPKEDANGSAFTLPLTQDGIYSPPNLPAPFPFFGQQYDKLYLAANGYIAFQDTNAATAENTVISTASHFAIPRISFLFSNLAPNISGFLWARILPDRIVATFEGIPEFQAFVNPPSINPNTVQVELFFSGRIRFTYLAINVRTAIVGLSDGQGMPLDPAVLFPGVRSVSIQSDFTAFPSNFDALTWAPLPIQQVDAGSQVEFTVRTEFPVSVPVPVLTAVWDGPGLIPFADNRDGSGIFRWQTTLLDPGAYTVRVTATQGKEAAYMDVPVYVGITVPVPTVSNLVIHSSNPVEDPRRSRPVDDDSPLTLGYNYSHPGEFLLPDEFAEGATQILWFRDNALIPALNDLKVVTPTATKPNERWFCMVTPQTKSGVAGMQRQSPVVTIYGLPRFLNVALPGDLPDSINPDALPLTDLPPASGPVSGGTTVVILGKRLDHPMSVTFGGIDAQSIRALDANRLEVVTPAHAASITTSGEPLPEDITVVTANGNDTLVEAFTYVGAGSSVMKADVNGDGAVDAADLQLVVNAVLQVSKAVVAAADVNRDGRVNAADIQAVINEVIR